MTPPARRKLLLATFCVLVVLVARALLSACLIQRGFRALSDDDYSRVVIAQLFAARPSLDPSQTSWLPFPFWLYGTVLAGFGNSLAVARALGFIIGLLSALLLWIAGRWLGLSRMASALGCLIAMSIPYSAWLGLATTPDVYSAALIVLACASLTRRRLVLRAIGAVAIVVALLSRYEAWSVALIWALFTSRDALRLREPRLALLVAAVLTAPLLWMLHGVRLHHDAFFFVKRVSSYQHALGALNGRGPIRHAGALWRLIADAPELWVLVIGITAAGLWHRVRFWHQRWTRTAVCLIGLLLFLCMGDWRGSTATHHGGRTLISVWNMISLVGAAALVAVTKRLAPPSRALLLFGALGSVLVAAVLVRPHVGSSDKPQNRSEEVELGLLAASNVPNGVRLAIDTPDYGYFAVQAAFARPLDTLVLTTHDPRERSDKRLQSTSEARVALERLSTPWLVTSRTEQRLLPLAHVLYRGPSLMLVQVR